MLIYTPKVGRLIHLEAFADDNEIKYFRGDVMRALMERGGEQVIQAIIDDCTTKTPAPEMHGQKLTISAVVMSQAELNEALDEAYHAGMRGARR